MRILATADAVGGVWTHALELGRGLAAHGVQTVLAVMGPAPDASQRAEADRVPGLELHHREFRLEWMDDPWTDVERAGEWLLELAARAQPDLVHLNGYAHAALPYRAPVLVAAHSCVASWWRAVRHEPAPSAWDRYRAEVRRGLDAAGTVAAPTRAMLDALEREHGRVRASRVIPNGRDAGAYPPAAKEPFVLAAGRLWDDAKNAAALARVAPHLAWPVVLAGDAVRPDGVPLELPNVRAFGRLSPTKLAALMSRAAVYALPARYEPFGLSALEAALAGCALVLGDIASLREVWGNAARFVDPEDDEALAGAIIRLVKDPGLRDHLAATARARALELSPERMAGAYLEAYRDLLATPTPAGLRAQEATTCAS